VKNPASHLNRHAEERFKRITTMPETDPHESICTWPFDGRAPRKDARPCNRIDCPHCRPGAAPPCTTAPAATGSLVQRLDSRYSQAWRLPGSDHSRDQNALVEGGSSMSDGWTERISQLVHVDVVPRTINMDRLRGSYSGMTALLARQGVGTR
jgi:hypothetical protein